MGINHAEPAYTDAAKPEIEEFGGKIGGLEFLRRHVPSLAAQVPPMAIVKPDEEYSGSDYGYRTIVRGSHPHDFQGLVDVIPTISVHTSTAERIEGAIREIRESCQSADVMTYGKYENPEYDGKVVIGISPHMEWSGSYRRGSIVEHPNQPGKFIVTWVHELGRDERDVLAGLFSDQGKLVTKYSYLLGLPEDMSSLTELYSKIRSANLVRDDFSFQLEFGVTPGEAPWIYQVRAFMRKVVSDFSIDEDDDVANSLVLGVTSPNGIELPVFHNHFGEDETTVPQPQEEYALLSSVNADHRGHDFMPRNMTAYLPSRSFGFSAWPNLEHGHYWKMQKAEVTVFEPIRHSYDEFMLDKDGRGIDGEPGLRKSGGMYVRNSLNGIQPNKARIISDGIRGKVEVILP